MHFILASGSLRRKALLRRIIPHFSVIKPTVNEDINNLKSLTPQAYVQAVACAKVGRVVRRSCLRQIRRGGLKDGIVIGADTIVFARGKIIGKPGNAQGAYSILNKLSGTKHSVITGVCVLNVKTGRLVSGYEETILRLKRLTLREMMRLANRKHYWDKAGGYALQEQGRDPYVQIVKGRIDNAVGLPLTLVRQLIISVTT